MNNILSFDTASRGQSGVPAPVFPASLSPTPQDVVDGLLASIFRDAPTEEDAKAKIIMALLAVAKGYRRETRQ